MASSRATLRERDSLNEVVSLGGLDLEIASSGPEPTAGQESGAEILFLHGLGGDCRSFSSQLEALGTQHRCVSWTMPGYGRSAAPEPFDFASLADVGAALIEHLGWRSPTVVGHSMGGYVAQELALRHPDSVGSLVLAGTTAAFGKPGSDFNRDFLAARLAPLDDGKTPADLAQAVASGLLGQNADDKARQAAVASMSAITVPAYRRALQTLVTWNAGDRLAQLDKRTLCLAGELDTTAPPRAMERLSAAIDGSQLVVLPEAGHLMYADSTDEFNRLILSFVQRAA